MAFAALLIGFARAIFVVLEEGQVVDTLVSGLFAPLGHLPVASERGRDDGGADGPAFSGAERRRPGGV